MAVAINRFVRPVPLVALWVFATNYLAQLLIRAQRQAGVVYAS